MLEWDRLNAVMEGQLPMEHQLRQKSVYFINWIISQPHGPWCNPWD